MRDEFLIGKNIGNKKIDEKLFLWKYLVTFSVFKDLSPTNFDLTSFPVSFLARLYELQNLIRHYKYS